MAESKKTKIIKESPRFNESSPKRCIFDDESSSYIITLFNAANVIVLFIVSAVNFQLVKSSYTYHLKTGATRAQIV